MIHGLKQDGGPKICDSYANWNNRTTFSVRQRFPKHGSKTDNNKTMNRSSPRVPAPAAQHQNGRKAEKSEDRKEGRPNSNNADKQKTGQAERQNGNAFMRFCVYVFVCVCVDVFMCLCFYVFMCLCVAVCM